MDKLTLGRLSALTEVATATQMLLVEHDEVRDEVDDLARLAIALEVCEGLDMTEEAQGIADEVGITPALIDRLTDDDVQERVNAKVADSQPYDWYDRLLLGQEPKPDKPIALDDPRHPFHGDPSEGMGYWPGEDRRPRRGDREWNA